MAVTILKGGVSVRERSETFGELISSGYAIYITSSGIANETTIIDSGSARVVSGGIANETRIYSGGTMYISNDGVAHDTAVYSKGVCYISSGGLARSTTVNSSGALFILSGAEASDTIINHQGYTSIAGVANNIEVNGGSLIVGAGGTATAVKENGGAVEFAENATVSFVPNTISGRTLSGSAIATLHSGTVALDTIMDYAYMHIYSGGVARNTLIDLGYMYISSGGLADFVSVVSGGRMLVSTGGIARNIFVYSSGSASISSGGIAEHITVNSGAVVSVFSSGTATIDFNPWAGSVASATGANITYLERDAKIYLGGNSTGLLAKQDEMSGQIVSSGISAIVYDDGSLDNTTVMIGGTINVSSGGVAKDTTVSGGSVFLRGNASNTVMHGGYLYLYDNGYIYDTILNSGYLRIYSGGIANGTSVSSDGYMYVSNGGIHRGSLQLNAGAVVSAYEGSTIDFTLTNRTQEDGYLINDLSLIKGSPTYTITVFADQAAGTYKLAQGASSFTGSITVGTETETYGTLTVNGEALNHQDAIYSLVKDEGNLLLKIDLPAVFIYSSGTLISAGSVVTGEMLNEGKTMYISSGGVASSTTIDGFYGSAIMYVSSGGSATSTTVISGGSMLISSGGVANSTTVSSGGIMYISNGGVATSTTVSSVGIMYISSGGVATSTAVINGSMFISSGGVANKTRLDRGGDLYISSGGVANSTDVGFHGSMYISSGGVANSTDVGINGSMFISSGGSATSTTVSSGGIMYISSGGSATSTTVSSVGIMYISSGGSATSTTVSSGGIMYISSGGTATNVIWTPCEGRIIAADGAHVTYASQYSGVYFNSSGLFSSAMVMDNKVVSGYVGESYMYVMSGGIANSTFVGKSGYMYISGGGVANSTRMMYGSMYISSGGSATSTEVDYGGKMYISSDGVATSTTVSSGGSMNVSSGGTHRGSLQLNAGAVVSAYEGSTIDFTLTDRTPEDGYLINDLSAISGAPTYTITVSADQAVGMYKLAQGASSFSGSITIGTETENYGTLTVNGKALNHQEAIYSLIKDEGNLLLKIDQPAVFIYSSGTLVSSGSVVTGETLVEGMNDSMHISSGGVASETTVSSGGKMYISNGGVANSTAVIEGSMFISSGGVANSTTVNGYGYMFISSGGVADNTTVSGGSMYVMSGGVADSTTVSSGGDLYISSGGVANSTTVSGYGYMHVSNGGSASSVTVNSAGRIQIDRGGSAVSLVLHAGGRLGVFFFAEERVFDEIVDGSATIGENVFIRGNEMHITNGGVADSTTVISGGSMLISSGGVANSTTVSSGGYLYISSGGSATSTTVRSGGFMRISSGGVANNTIVSRYGSMFISSGGVANKTRLDHGGDLYISSGGVANSTTVNGYGYMFISSGGVANSTTVSSRGFMRISSGGVANNTTVSRYGSMFIYSGGVANKTRLDHGGDLYIFSGGVANSTTVNASGSMRIASGGVANHTTVISGGSMLISSGGTATDVVWTPCVGYVSAADGAYVTYASQYTGVYFGSADQLLSSAMVMDNKIVSGSMYVMSGGVADNTTVSGGSMYVMSGGVADSTTVSSGGRMYIASGGVANSTTVISDGYMHVSNGGSASSVTVSGGYMYISSGGVATSTTVNASGSMRIASGGVASNTFVTLGGEMYLSSGSMHRGELQLSHGAVVSAYKGSIIDFTLTDRTPEDGYLINDLSLISGTPTYTITVSADQAVGMYKLAQGAADFDQVITIGTELESYGTLTINGAGITVGKYIYSLVLDGSSLSLNAAYSDIAGPILEIFGNPTAWTNRDVVLTASASNSPSGLASIEYSLDNVDWIKGESVSVSKNGMVYFRATDNAGNITTQSVVVNRIDKTAPAVGRLTVKQQDQNRVLLTVSGFTDNVKIARYDFYLAGKKIGSSTNGIFTYNGASNLTGTLNFSVNAVDTVGNVSETKSASVTTQITVVGEATEKTTELRWAQIFGTVHYEITFAGNKKVYKSKTTSITVKKLAAGSHNVTVYAVDKAKQRVLVASNVPITVKDITAPKGGKVKLSQRNQNSVLVSISGFTDNVKVARYDIYLNGRKVGSTTSNSYVYNGTNLAGSLKFSVRAFDAAGNAAKDKKATIKIKDATAPDRVVGLRVVGKANEKVTTLSWNRAGDNVGVTQYEIRVSGSSKVYKSKTTSITIKKLSAGAHTFTVTAIDKAKNRSVVSQSVKFTVLDGTAPKGGKVSLSQLNANSVRVSISGFTDNVKVARYDIYLNGTKVGSTSTNSFTYKGGSALSGSLKFSVMAVDAAGNVSKAKNATLKIKAAPAARSMPEGPLDLEIGGIASNSFARLPDERNSAAPGAALKGFISGTAGADVVEFAADLSRYLDGMSLGAGNDTVILEQSGTPSVVDVDPLSGYGLMDLGAGNDLVRLEANTELESALDLGLGNDTLIIEKGATLDLDIAGLDFGAGSDKLVLNGTLEVDCGLISGLETVVGNGEVIISGSGSVDDSLKSKFKNAGIKVTTIA